MKLTTCVAALPAASFLLILSGCLVTTRTSDPVDESRSVDLPAKAEMVSASIRMGAGDLRLQGGAAKLMEADFRYNVPSWKPEVRYNQTGFRGRMEVTQQGSGHVGNKVVNKWDIRLNDDLPIDLETKLGAGEAKLDLGGMTLRSATLEIGAGEADIRFSTEPQRSFDLSVRGGVGEATIRVPKTVGVIATAKGGIGDINMRNLKQEGDTWTNEAYGKAKTTVRIDVKGGIGQINIYSE